jgi:hypothetical protein
MHTALVILGYGAAGLLGIPVGIFLGMWLLDRALSTVIGGGGWR